MSALAAAALASLAIVAQDQTALRAAPSASAMQQVQLSQGDLLEVRGERLGHLQVYDHQRERAGFVKASQVRAIGLQEADAPQLLAVLRFLRDAPGSEALGIAYVAAYLKAVPAQAITAEPFDALGVMAERLARRASARAGSAAAPAVAAHLEVAGRYGVRFESVERDGAIQLCYDGDAFRRVLTLPAPPAMATASLVSLVSPGAPAWAEQQARAALALTRHDCIDPALPPHRKQPLDRARADLLSRLSPAQELQLSEPSRNRLRLRRAGVWAALAFASSRGVQKDEATSQAAGQRALNELAAVNRAELGDDEQADYTEAALRVSASRWAAEPVPPHAGPLKLALSPGEPGQTCVQLGDSTLPPGRAPVLARRCTFGSVWLSSARPAPDGRALVLSVQPLDSWTELWVFRANAAGWVVDVLPPAAAEPGLGYVEFAGWMPGPAPRLLLAREARVEGRNKRSFEVLALDTLAAEKQVDTPQQSGTFTRWQDSQWRRQTLSLR